MENSTENLENSENLVIEPIGQSEEKENLVIEPYNSESTKFDYESLSPEEKERYDEINDLIKAETLEPTTALNILINAVQVSYDKDHFNDLDRYLIAKSLTCLKSYSDAGEDIVIKVS